LGKNVRIEFSALPAPWATFVPLQAGEKPIDPLLCLDKATLERKYDNDRNTYRLALDKESEKVRNKVEVTVLSRQKDDLYNSIAYLDRFIEALRTTKASLDTATTMSGLELIAVPLGGDIAKKYEKPRTIQIRCVEHRKNDSRTPEVPLGVGDVVTEKTIYESVTDQQKKEIAVIKKTLASLAGNMEKKIADGNINLLFELPGLVKSAFSLFGTIDKIKENMVPVTRKAFQERLSDLPPDTTSSFLFTKVASGKNVFPPVSSWPDWAGSLMPDSRVKDKNDLQEGTLTLGEVSLKLAMIPDKQTLAETRLELATKILGLERQRKEYELKRKEICKKINTLLDTLALEKAIYGCPDLIPVSLGGVTGYTNTIGETVTIKGNGFSPQGNSISFVSGDGVALGSLRDLSSDGESLSLVIPSEIFEKGSVSFYISVKNASGIESTPLWIRPPTIQRRSDSSPSETLFSPNQRYCGETATDKRIFTGVAHDQSGAPKIEVLVDPEFERDTLRGERKITGDIPLTPVYDLVVRVTPTINEYCLPQWDGNDQKVSGVLPPSELPFDAFLMVGVKEEAILLGKLLRVDKNPVTQEWRYEWKLKGWQNGIVDAAKMEKLILSITNNEPVYLGVLTYQEVNGEREFKWEKSSVSFSVCAPMWGSGQHKVVFGRMDNTDYSLPKFIQDAESVRTSGFEKTDPFNQYRRYFSHLLDLHLSDPMPFNNSLIKLANPVSGGPRYNLRRHNDTFANLSAIGSSCGNSSVTVALGKTLNPGQAAMKGKALFVNKEVERILKAEKYHGSLPIVVLHEFGHAFAGLNDEYEYGGPDKEIPMPFRNCSTVPQSAWTYNNVRYGDTVHKGCSYSSVYRIGTGANKTAVPIYRPSDKSMMKAAQSGEFRFNVVSCGYIIEAIKGGKAQDYWQECMGYDTVKPTGVGALRYIFSPLLSLFDRDSSGLTAQVGGANDTDTTNENDYLIIESFDPNDPWGQIIEIVPDSEAPPMDPPEQEVSFWQRFLDFFFPSKVPVSVTSITGYTGIAGQTVTIKGTGFSETGNTLSVTSTDNIYFSSVKADSSDGTTLTFKVPQALIDDGYLSFFVSVKNVTGVESTPYFLRPPTTQQRRDSSPAGTNLGPNQRYCVADTTDTRVITGVQEHLDGSPKIKVVIGQKSGNNLLCGGTSSVYDLTLRVTPIINDYCLPHWDENDQKISPAALPPEDLPFPGHIVIGESLELQNVLVGPGVLKRTEKDENGNWVYEWKIEKWPEEAMSADKLKKLFEALGRNEPINALFEIPQPEGSREKVTASIPFDTKVPPALGLYREKLSRLQNSIAAALAVFKQKQDAWRRTPKKAGEMSVGNPTIDTPLYILRKMALEVETDGNGSLKDHAGLVKFFSHLKSLQSFRDATLSSISQFAGELLGFSYLYPPSPAKPLLIFIPGVGGEPGWRGATELLKGQAEKFNIIGYTYNPNDTQLADNLIASWSQTRLNTHETVIATISMGNTILHSAILKQNALFSNSHIVSVALLPGGSAKFFEYPNPPEFFLSVVLPHGNNIAAYVNPKNQVHTAIAQNMRNIKDSTAGICYINIQNDEHINKSNTRPALSLAYGDWNGYIANRDKVFSGMKGSSIEVSAPQRYKNNDGTTSYAHHINGFYVPELKTIIDSLWRKIRVFKPVPQSSAPSQLAAVGAAFGIETSGGSGSSIETLQSLLGDSTFDECAYLKERLEDGMIIQGKDYNAIADTVRDYLELMGIACSFETLESGAKRDLQEMGFDPDIGAVGIMEKDIIPTITSFTGYSATPGEIVTIHGSGFSLQGNTVFLDDGDNQYTLSAEVKDSKTLTFQIPRGAIPPEYISLKSFNVSVTNASGGVASKYLRAPSTTRRSDGSPATSLGTGGDSPSDTSQNASSLSLPGFLQRLSGLLDRFVPFIIGLAVFVILWGIFIYITKATDEEKRAEAKQFIIYGIIGVFVMLSLWGFVNLLLNTFDIRREIEEGDIPKVPTIE